jgi:hypothetical protein
MTLAFFIFLASSKRYVKKPASGDPLRGLLYYIAKGAGTGLKVRLTSCIAWPARLVHVLILFVFAPSHCRNTIALTLQLPFILLVRRHHSIIYELYRARSVSPAGS